MHDFRMNVRLECDILLGVVFSSNHRTTTLVRHPYALNPAFLQDLLLPGHSLLQACHLLKVRFLGAHGNLHPPITPLTLDSLPQRGIPLLTEAYPLQALFESCLLRVKTTRSYA
jgi:hypothetical protein